MWDVEFVSWPLIGHPDEHFPRQSTINRESDSLTLYDNDEAVRIYMLGAGHSDKECNCTLVT